ncbi:MAG: NAD-dependent deacylase [Bacteroidales bacterium]|nr:NAD-dependent deacylase [Bacteroidales bacterium]
MKKNVVVLTGAGISAESGIKTFRDSDGLWENYRIEDVANYDSFEKDSELVTKFYNARRRQLTTTLPNEGHKQLVRLEDKFNVTVITQNVDDLHERAGSKKIIHLHGELTKACSVSDKSEIYDVGYHDITPMDVDKNGEMLRPFIVWFGESVPMLEPAVEAVQKADILIIIGTSLVVYPAAGLIHYAPKDCKKYLVDPKRPDADLSGITFIEQKASVGVKQVVDQILEENNN